ncbi:mycofactocin biosynthesis chaperone MftB [Desulfocicer niacini]
MASAACIDKKIDRADPIYRLAPSVQVRPEDSGLLFYSSKGPRLYFLNSGSILDPNYFGSGIGLNTRLENNRTATPDIKKKLAAALDELVKKEVLVC